jgi:hypothetical protein
MKGLLIIGVLFALVCVSHAVATRDEGCMKKCSTLLRNEQLCASRCTVKTGKHMMQSRGTLAQPKKAVAPTPATTTTTTEEEKPVQPAEKTYVWGV